MGELQSLGEIMAKEGFQQPKSAGHSSINPYVEEFNCLVCHDRGWVAPNVQFDHPEFGQLRRCECMIEADKAEHRERLLRLCHLPTAIEDRTFENFQVRPGLEEAYQAALDVAEGRLQWLTLCGGVDCGKSHLAAAIVRKWLERRLPARFAVVPELLDELRQGYRPDADMTYEQEFHFFRNVDLLVLDDLGMESPTNWALEKLDMLVDHRCRNKLSLVVTTNMGLGQLTPRIASRLRREGKVLDIAAEEYWQWKSAR